MNSMIGDKVETDRAVAVMEKHSTEDLVPRYDSGCISGGNMSSCQASPLHTSTSSRVEYNRLDSGICERMSDQLRITDNEPKLAVTPQQCPGLEFFDADCDGDCQLHLAVAEGVTEVVFALIRLAPHPAYLDIQNNELYAPLHIAVLVNQPRLVRRLVVAGATTDIRDREGNTPLHLAAKRGFKECAAALLSPISTDELREADISAAFTPTHLHTVLDMKNFNGEHCVHLATFGQHYEFLWFLNLHQADMNASEGRSGKTALHYAVNMRDERLVQMLATPREAGGCGVALNARDWSGRTAHRCSKINGDEGIAVFLASLPGCDTHAEDSDEDFEFDTDDEVDWAGSYTDTAVNGSGMLIVESLA